jgi:hypothetical protein
MSPTGVKYLQKRLNMDTATLISSAEVPGKSVATMDVELRPTCG